MKRTNPIYGLYAFEKDRWTLNRIEEAGYLNMCDVFWNLTIKLVDDNV